MELGEATLDLMIDQHCHPVGKIIYRGEKKKKKKKKTAMEEMFTAKREGEKVAEWEDKWESIRTSQHSSE